MKINSRLITWPNVELPKTALPRIDSESPSCASLLSPSPLEPAPANISSEITTSRYVPSSMNVEITPATPGTRLGSSLSSLIEVVVSQPQ